MISYKTDGFNDRLRELVSQFVRDDDDANCFIKVMLMIEQQHSAEDMDFVGAVAAQFAFEISSKHAKQTKAHIEKLRAELLAEFAQEGE